MKRLLSLIIAISIVIMSFPVSAAAEGVLQFTNIRDDQWFEGDDDITVSWRPFQGAAHYEYSVRKLLEDELIFFHEYTTDTTFDIPFSDVGHARDMRVWVGAYDRNGELIAQSTLECVHTSPGPPKVEAYDATNITHSGALLNGRLLLNNGSAVFDYGFVWGETRDCKNKVSLGALGAEKRAFEHYLDNLEPDTRYYFRAYAENGVDISYSSRESFTTAEGETCAHAASFESIQGMNSVSISDTQHQNTILNDRVCVDCGAVLEAMIVVSQLQDHAFSDGACSYCGYAKNQEHSVDVCDVFGGAHAFEQRFDADHPHKAYNICECGEKNYTGDTRYDGACCLCAGHQWGSTRTQNGRAYQVCARCADTRDVQAPPGACRVHGGAHAFNERFELAHPHKLYLMCDCGERGETDGYKIVAACCDCSGHIWGDAYQGASGAERRCARCRTTEAVQAAAQKCTVYGEAHAFTQGYEIDHPHKEYQSCDCGEIYFTGGATTLSTCCGCVGHEWGEVIPAGGMYNQICDRCDARQPVMYTPPVQSEPFINNYVNGDDVIENFIAVAKTQLGYTGSNNINNLTGVLNEGEAHGDYTKYGEYAGAVNSHWCAAFVAWCGDQADASKYIKKGANAGPGLLCVNYDVAGAVHYYHYMPTSGYRSMDKPMGEVPTPYYAYGDYRPKRGELIFFNNSSSGAHLTHVGIVIEDCAETDTVIRYIHGNTSKDVVRESSIAVNDDSIDAFCDPFLALRGANPDAGTDTQNRSAQLLWQTPVKGTAGRDYYISRGWLFKDDTDHPERPYHCAIDYGTNKKTGVMAVAAADGIVRGAGFSSGNGNFVVIEHTMADGRIVSSFYAHLASINVAKNQRVTGGQVIGEIGKTGEDANNSIHLHFAIQSNTVTGGTYVGYVTTPGIDIATYPVKTTTVWYNPLYVIEHNALPTE